jgi:hypothetical protein
MSLEAWEVYYLLWSFITEEANKVHSDMDKSMHCGIPDALVLGGGVKLSGHGRKKPLFLAGSPLPL